VRVHFLQGEQTIAVERPGGTPADAVAALLAGPSPDEQRRRIVSELPEGLPLLGLEAAEGVATADFGRVFADGEAAAVSARLAQVVLTLTGLPGIPRGPAGSATCRRALRPTASTGGPPEG
jgi:spore germination protein GerM